MTTAAAWLADRAPIRALIVTGAGRAFSPAATSTGSSGASATRTSTCPRRCARRGGPAQGDRRPPPHPLPGDRRDQRPRGRGRHVAGARVRHPDRVGESLLRVAYGRIGASPDGGMTYFLPRVVGPAKALEMVLNDPNLTPTRPRGGAGHRGGLRRRADDARAGEGREAGRQGALLRADDEAPASRSIENSLADHLQLERHGIADSMATKDPASRRHRLLQRRKARLPARPGRPGSPRWVLGVSSRSWLAVTAMRRPGREGFVTEVGTGSGGGRTYVGGPRERSHTCLSPVTKMPGTPHFPQPSVTFVRFSGLESEARKRAACIDPPIGALIHAARIVTVAQHARKRGLPTVSVTRCESRHGSVSLP